ncbi:MAG: phosphodiester glycosidase family protein [Chthoniobacterales bacterium]
MKRLSSIFLAVILLAPAAKSTAGDFSKIDFEGVTYRVFRCQPEEVRIFWRGDDGQPLGQFSKLQQQLARRGERLEFVMNAGIFGPDYAPNGLHIEEGREVLPLNRHAGKGNFYLGPTGVFCIVGNTARILETEEYAKAKLHPRLALQSGPLLMRDAQIHPAFQKTSTSRLHRNGVGIDAQGRVVFAITDLDGNNLVNLYGFTEFFRSLGCRDALFLDGDISAMTVNPDAPIPPGNHFGAILAVTQKTAK